MFNAPKSVIPHHFVFLNVVKVIYKWRVNADQEVMGLGKAWNRLSGGSNIEQEHPTQVWRSDMEVSGQEGLKI